MARVYVAWQDDALTDHAKDTEGSAQNTNFNSRKQLHSGKQLDLSLNLSTCFSLPGTAYKAPDYQSFAQSIIRVIKNNVVKNLKEIVLSDQSRGQFHLGFCCCC